MLYPSDTSVRPHANRSLHHRIRTERRSPDAKPFATRIAPSAAYQRGKPRTSFSKRIPAAACRAPGVRSSFVQSAAPGRLSSQRPDRHASVGRDFRALYGARRRPRSLCHRSAGIRSSGWRPGDVGTPPAADQPHALRHGPLPAPGARRPSAARPTHAVRADRGNEPSLPIATELTEPTNGPMGLSAAPAPDRGRRGRSGAVARA